MSDIFISHVEEDADIALTIALGLEEAGYTAWSYELDSIPGPSYLVQTGEAVEASQVIVVVISPHSLGSRQVTSEVVRAHETNKRFIPVLRNITHAEFQKRQPIIHPPEIQENMGGQLAHQPVFMFIHETAADDIHAGDQAFFQHLLDIHLLIQGLGYQGLYLIRFALLQGFGNRVQ